MRRLAFVLLVYFSRRPPQSWLLGLEFLVLLPKCLLQQPLVARGLATQVAFIVSTVAEMDMMRIIVTRRRGRLSLSLAEVGVPHMFRLRLRLSFSILMHSRRYSCYFVVLLFLHLFLHLLEPLVLSLLELLVLSLLPQYSLLLLLSLLLRDHHPLQVSCHGFLILVLLFI